MRLLISKSKGYWKWFKMKIYNAYSFNDLHDIISKFDIGEMIFRGVKDHNYSLIPKA